MPRNDVVVGTGSKETKVSALWNLHIISEDGEYIQINKTFSLSNGGTCNGEK